MAEVLILTTAHPDPNRGTRPEKLAYRCNKLIEWGHNPTVVVPSIKFDRNRVELESGTVQYCGPTIGSATDRSNSSDTDTHPLWKRLAKAVFFPTSSKSKSPLDAYYPYAPTTYRFVSEFVRRAGIDVLNTHCFPFTTNALGLALTKRIESLKWLMEYRDPWVNHPNQFPNGPDPLNKFLERKSIATCDAIIYFDGIQIPPGYFTDTYPEYESKVTDIGYIGYDEQKIDRIEAKHLDSFTVTYAGSLYRENFDLRPFFKGISQFITNNDIHPDSFQVVFLGDSPTEEYGQFLDERGISEYVDPKGWTPPEECLSYIKGSEYGIYINRQSPHDRLSISQKMWDYIGCDTPVLCFSKEGWESWDLVADKELGIVADEDDAESISNVFDEIYPDAPHSIPSGVKTQYSRRACHERYREVLESLV